MHIWQDYVISVGMICFSAALIPSITGKDKPAFFSSAMTAVILGIFVLTYTTLSLPFTTFAIALNCLAWSILAVQKYRQNKAK